MKKILILYAKYGGGHYSAAKAINEYINENYTNIETNLVDCMEYINKVINKISTGAYKQITKNAPRLWKGVYYHSEKGALSRISNSSNKVMARKLNHLIDSYSPDIVISTHMFATQMISYLKKKGKTNCILATVLTDFAPHEQWIVGKEYGDYFFVSHENMKNDLINKFGINKEKIFATGIPLSSRFEQKFTTHEIYSAFDLTLDKKVILFFGGGEFGLGKNYTTSILRALSNYLESYQIIAISGKNEKMNTAFKQVAKDLGNPKELKIYDFITNVPEAMSICSLVVTKPGGLTSSESLASGLPMLIINPIPGQEEENAEFLEQSGVALWLRPSDSVEVVIHNLLNSPKELAKMSENTKKIAKIHSTRDICEIILGTEQM